MIPCSYDALTGFYRDSFCNTDEVLRRKLGAQIYALPKIEVDTRTYVTDKKGIVVFDSDNDREKGEDYSNQRHHESLSNLTPADVYFERGESILEVRKRILELVLVRRLSFSQF